MSPGADRSNEEWGTRLIRSLLILAGAGVLLIYVDRIFLDLPLYPGDEGAYLIHALYGKALAADPTLAPQLQGLTNTAFLLIIRAVTYGGHHVIEWLRLLGGLAYFAGLLMTWRAVAPNLERRVSAAFLVLALSFPYYRHVFTALPDGWYVGVLGAIILTTARLYLARPVVHALIAGALTGILVLLKPHGVTVAASMLALAVLDFAFGRRRPSGFAAHTLIYIAAFIASGNLIQVAAGAPIASPLGFIVGGHYAQALSEKLQPGAEVLGLRSLACMAAGALLLAGVPIATGVSRIVARWRWASSRGGFKFEQVELTFLMVLFAFGATLAMVAIFAMKAQAAFGNTEADRLWGRYFEFFTPLLWLVAAPFIGEFERGGGRPWRIGMTVVTLLGLGGLCYFLLSGVMMFPWDGSALAAFFRPDLARWNFDAGAPLFALAVAASLAIAMTCLTSIRMTSSWLAYFIVLGALSAVLDVRWAQTVTPVSDALGAELETARAIVAREPDAVAAVVDDMNRHHVVLMGLAGRPHMILATPDAPIGALALANYDTVVVSGRHELTGGTWRALFVGQEITVFRRDGSSGPQR